MIRRRAVYGGALAILGLLGLTGPAFAQTAPPGPTLVSPSGSGVSTSPTYTWNVADGAPQYYLWVNDPSGTPVVQVWYDAAAVCSGTLCSATPSSTLALGTHTWWVQARNAAGDSLLCAPVDALLTIRETP